MPTESPDCKALVLELRGRFEGFLNHASILDLGALKSILEHWFEDPVNLRGDGIPRHEEEAVAKARRLHAEGWTDQEIADGVGDCDI